MSDDDVFLTPQEAAQLLGISVSSLRGRIRRGEVKAYRLRRSRLLRLRRADVLGLLEPVQPPATALRVVKNVQPLDMQRAQSER